MIENELPKLNVELIENVLRQRHETGKEFMETIYKPGCNTSIQKLREKGVNFSTACKIADHLGVTLDALRSDRTSNAGSFIKGNYNNNNGYLSINDHVAELNALKLENQSLNAIIKEKEQKEALYERLLSMLKASKDETVSLYERESNKK